MLIHRPCTFTSCAALYLCSALVLGGYLQLLCLLLLLFHCNLLMFAGLASPCFFVCWQNQLRASAVHLSAVVMALRKGFALNWHHHIVGL